jgi:hypothetical protein
MTIVQTIAQKLSNAFRVLNVLRFGASDVVSAYESAPAGYDGAPNPNVTAVFSETKVNGRNVIVGYIDKNKVAQSGESRLFSQDQNGNLLFNVYLADDGNLYLGTSPTLSDYSDFLVKFNELQTAWNNFRDNEYNLHTHETGTGPSSPPETPAVTSFDSAKAATLKLQ